MDDNSEMSGQRYKRTNFDDDDNISNGGTPPPIDFNPSIVFKGGLTVWQKKTVLERVLIVLLIIVVVSLIVLAALLAVKDAEVKDLKKGPGVCLTPECVTVASTILNSMDRTADPCQNFYQYACGGWIKKNPIPSGHSRWGTFEVLIQQNELVIKNSIEKPIQSFSSEAEKKAKIYYESCIDVNKTIEKLGATPLLDVLKGIGGWSISDLSGLWSPSGWDFQTTLERVHLVAVSPLFSVWVSVDERNSTRNILQADQSGLGLPNRDYYLNKSITDNKELSAYLEYMTTVGVLLGATDENSTREEMIRVIEFETALANITIPAAERRDEEKLYNKMTIDKLQQNYMSPHINVLHYFNARMGVVNITVTSKEDVVVYAPKYLTDLKILLNSTLGSEDGKRTLNNYLIWHVVASLAPSLSKPFRDAKKKFVEALKGVTGSDEAWRYCIRDTDGVLGFATGAMFVKDSFHGGSKEKAEEMITAVRTAFKNNLPKLSWMDDETRKAAVEKADAVVDMIGFPEYILNATRLDKEYDRLKVNKSEYFQNNMRNLRFVLIQNLEMLRKAPKKNAWGMTPPTVNAYYSPTKNEIVFPAGILQAPFYSQHFPTSLNYGAMGVVMGHELTHGFDDQGREYDKNGNLRPWWNKASIEKFKKQTKCMEDQYSKYKINGKAERGKQTLGENIADNGGLKSAYHAYENWVQRNGEEQLLPALGLSHRQLFFMAFSQVWCSIETPQAQYLQLVTDAHSPGKYRVIGTLSNSKEFAKEYNCALGTPMNPQKKCEVW